MILIEVEEGFCTEVLQTVKTTELQKKLKFEIIGLHVKMLIEMSMQSYMLAVFQ